MYLDFYKLTTKPFQITVDPKFLWLGEKHKEALATLRYGIVDNRGFLLLTGEVGTGKTILINRITTMLDIDTVVATLPDPDLESMDFYNLLADGLNMKRTFESKGAFLIHLRDFLHQSYANQKQVLLIIDESQRLNSKLMEDIRVLSNIELHDRKLINIFFVGQQEFNSILMTPQNRALAQRITVRYHIEALNEQETGEYIKHRLEVAGRKTPLFKDSAQKEIYHFSGGIPRLINIISDHALLTGYAQGAKRIDGNVVQECAEELRIPVQNTPIDAATLRTSQDITGSGGVPAAVATSEESSTTAPKAVSKKTIPAEDGQPEKEKPAAWNIANVMMILLLIAGVVYAVNQFSNGGATQYDESELTPKKYKSSLEREKELLTDRLEQSDAAGGDDSQRRGSEVRPPEPMPIEEQTASPEKPDMGLPVPEVAVQETSVPENTDPVNGPSETADAIDGPVSGDKPGLAQEMDPEHEKVSIEPLPLLDETIVVQFEINSNEIDQQSYAVLDRVAAHLVRHPEKKIKVRGYTDSSGSQGYNESVSRFRASVIKSYLIGKGAVSENIEVFAMGAANPMASNETIAGRRLNRRVEIEFTDVTTVTP